MLPASKPVDDEDVAPQSAVGRLEEGRRLFRFYLWACFGLSAFATLVALIACVAGSYRKWESASTAVVVGWAAFMSVGMLGLIFGVPRSVADPDQSRTYWANTNLEQISDWLTKILVGVGLAQARPLVNAFKELSDSIGDALAIGGLGPTLAAALMLVCGPCGFLYAYLWSRLYFIPLLEVSDRLLREHGQGKDRTTQ